MSDARGTVTFTVTDAGRAGSTGECLATTRTIAADTLLAEHAARRWALARRCGYLEGAINSALAALDAGADGEVVAKVLREMLHSPEAPR